MTYHLQYITDETGKATSVIVPIDLWKELSAERETAYLLKSQVMRTRLLEAVERNEGIPFDEARQKLGI